MSKILGTLLLIVILLTSCNKAQELVIPKQDLKQEEQPTNTTIPDEPQVVHDVDKSVSPDTKIDIKDKAKIARIAAWITLAATGSAVIYSFYKFKKIEMPSGNYDPDKCYKAFLRILEASFIAVAANAPVIGTAVCLTHEANRNKKKLEP